MGINTTQESPRDDINHAKPVTKDCTCCSCDPCTCDPCHCCNCCKCDTCNCDPCTCCQCGPSEKKGGNCGCGSKKLSEPPKKGCCFVDKAKKVEEPIKTEKKGGCCGDKKPVKKAKQVTKDCCCDPCQCCTCDDCNCDPCQCCQCTKTEKKGGDCGCGPKKVGGCASKKVTKQVTKDCCCNPCKCCKCDECHCNPCQCCQCAPGKKTGGKCGCNDKAKVGSCCGV